MGSKKSDMTLRLNSNNEEYDPSKTLSGSYENCSEEVREEASMYVSSGVHATKHIVLVECYCSS